MIPKNHILFDASRKIEGQVVFETSCTRFQKTSKRWLFVIFFNRIDHSDEMSLGFQHPGTRSGRFYVLSIYWDQNIVSAKVHLIHGPKFNDFQVSC